MDLYRVEAEIAHVIQQGIRSLVAQGKPVAITEFGCTTYRGAADHGARAAEIVEYERDHPGRLNGDYVRDEAGQATYLRELLDVFTRRASTPPSCSPSLSTASRTARGDPREDLDMASWGIVKVLEGPPRRHLPRHALGTQGGLHRSRRLLPGLIARGPGQHHQNALRAPISPD